ncbi:uncharacterized protein BJX67DRAFT_289615 [Aspergillus lucknowensis]|uniref:Uncharacterized protein n=1 Tax=Aspergillus lucknowensis TaxID=176173 RepID=A0ABR4LE45_9EURO
MPPLALSSLPLHVPRSVVATGNATDVGLQVVCAWPVSGQYGPGTRVLYYVLIAACVFARKEEWLRNACLAAALLFPAIAALHAIVLAAVHVDGAVDMDVYGAFQLCSIGILTAPLTARMSGTYFKDPRRNIIFLWTGLMLAGLLSITVELFRVKPAACTHDELGNPIDPDISKFPYNTTCHLRCSVDDGPFSPIRVGSTNEIYVIPAPDKLAFGTVTLLAAACCIPAIVSLLYFWSLILRETWNKRFEASTETDRRDEPIEGTNGATVGMMQQINGLVRTILSAVEAPVFAAAVLAILILGEKNFFSDPVDYETEPISSIGQWAPIAGAAFAILGSLYLFLTGDDASPAPEGCECSCHESPQTPGSGGHPKQSSSSRDSEQNLVETTTPVPHTAHVRPARQPTTDVGSRRKINRVLVRLGTTLSIAAHDRLHDYEFKQGPALDFPEIPAEEQRNEALHQIREQYNPKRDSHGNITLSRVGSNLSVVSSRGRGRSSSNSHGTPPRPSRQTSSSRSPSPIRPSSPRGSDCDRSTSELHDIPTSSSTDDPATRPRKRQNTLEVPAYNVPMRRSPSISSVSSSSFTVPGSPASPIIVVSADGDISPPPQAPETQAAPPIFSTTAEQPDPPASLLNGRRFTS